MSEEQRELLALEQELWAALVKCLRLTRQLRSTEAQAGGGAAEEEGKEDGEDVRVPEPMRLLMPPAPEGGWPAGTPRMPAAGEALAAAYPPSRRAQRLSFLVAALLPELDRQTLLQAPPTSARLKMELLHVKDSQARLAALAALRGLD